MKTLDVECAILNQKVMVEAMSQLKLGNHKSSRSKTYRMAMAELASKSPKLKATIEERPEKNRRIIHCKYYEDCKKEKECIYK